MDKARAGRQPTAADLFTAVGNQRGNMKAAIVEEDFWVCWLSDGHKACFTSTRRRLSHTVL